MAERLAEGTGRLKMTEQDIRELYEERLAIMVEGNSRDLDWFDTNEVNKRLQRAAYFDTKRQIGGLKMPSDLNPDKRQEVEPVRAMRSDAKHIDFGFLAGAIPSNPKALPSNIDGIYERGGRFLVLEFKKPQEKLGVGQEIMLKKMTVAQNWQVWIVTGNFDTNPIEFHVAEKLLPNGTRQTIAETLVEFRYKIKSWHDGIR